MDIFGDKIFSKMMKNHIKELIEYLLKKEQFFSILTKIDEIKFDPKLPSHISSNFRAITPFYIAEYTFESASIDDDFLYFEAGFGAENIGSYITVPLLCIVQIIVDDKPILINMAVEHKKEKESDDGVKRSTNIFLSNPKNRKIIEKRDS